MKKLLPIFIALFAFGFIAKGQTDLVLTQAMVVSPTNLHIGQNDTIIFQVTNSGFTNSVACHIGIYISSTPVRANAQLMGEVAFGALAIAETSDVIKYVHPIPYNFSSVSAYIFIELDDLAEIPLEITGNNESISSPINLTVAWAEQHIPYPIIFIHGFCSDDRTWSTLKDSLLSYYGWSFGGNMDFCLNKDGSTLTSDSMQDYHDFTGEPNHILNPNPCDFYTVNFDVDDNGVPYNSFINESNQSGIVKQGLAVRDAIAHVLQITGKDRVILVCHSMGGLAAREYLQSPPRWHTPNIDHAVAKLCTIGTPHGGTNVTDFGIDLNIYKDLRSEAVRDMRTSYTYSLNQGVYLFGGQEDLGYMKDQLLNVNNFYNADVNCNGVQGNNISPGLNNRYYPTDLSYSCVIGTNNILGGDGIVSEYSANINHQLPVGADTFVLVQPFGNISFWHTVLQEKIPTCMQVMDEPNDFYHHAYKVSTGQLYYGLITMQSNGTPGRDYDNYKINIPADGNLNIHLYNIPLSTLRINIYNSSYTSVFYASSLGKSSMDVSATLTAGNYYIVLNGIPTNDSWRSPYAFKLDFTPATALYCSGTTTLTTPTGTFTDGSGASNYNNNSDCRWKIQPSGATSILLSFPAFNISSPDDTVYVYDGATTASPILGAFTGTLATNVTSTGGSMLVRFKTNGSTTAPGWTANYTATVVQTYCNGTTTLTAPSGSFSDGSGNVDYGNNANCSWLISPAGAFSITLNFTTFNTESVNDVVNVYDGSDNTAPLIGSFSGTPLLSSLTSTSTGGAMFIEFVSNGTATAPGWNASYTSDVPFGNNGIVEYEYWFDDDYASAVVFPVSPQEIFHLNSSIPTSGLTEGLHIYHIRFKDSDENWGSVFSQAFYRHQALPYGDDMISFYEYWFDDDYASKFSSVVSPPQSEFNLTTPLSTSTVAIGLHAIHIRFKSNGGEWSSVLSKSILVTSDSSGNSNALAKYEYWYDDDYASKTFVSIAPTSTYTLTGELISSNLSEGLHSLHIRFGDNVGSWSSVLSKFFYKAGTTATSFYRMNKYRYWFDNDTAAITTKFFAVPLPIENLFDTLDANALSTAKHYIHFQFQDDLSQWSSVLTDSFYVGTLPIALYSVADTSVCSNTVVSFTNNSVNANTYAWTFGDGGTSTLANPTHTYSANGTFTVTLIATNTISGLTDTLIGHIVVSNTTATISAVGSTTFCQGDSVRLNANTGVGFTWQWLLNASPVSGAVDSFYYATQAGSYSVIVTNVTGCSKTSSVLNVTVNAVPQAQISSLSTSICQGDSVILNANTGIGITYQWKKNGATISGATANAYYVSQNGNYSVVETNSNGCRDTSNIISIVINPLPTVSLNTNTFITCVGNSITLFTTSADSLGSYTWFQDSIIIFGADSATQNVNQTATYSVLVYNQFGCRSVSNSLAVSFYSAQAIVSTQGDSGICQGDSILLSANGGNGFTYQWQYNSVDITGHIQQTAFATQPGDYTVVLTDTLGCLAISPPFTVNGFSNPFPFITGANLICQGGSTTLDAGFGFTDYHWSTSDTSQAIAVTAAGNYFVTVIDINGCVGSDTIGVSVASPLTDSMTTTPEVCGLANGTATIFVNGSVPPYTYSWFPSGETTQSDTGLSSGIHIVTVTDSIGCATTDSVGVGNSGNLGLGVNHSNTHCNGDSTGTAIALTTGGTPPFTYSWLPSLQTNDTVCCLPASNYTCTVTDSNGCSYSIQFVITEPTIVSASADSGMASCQLCCDGLSTINVSGGTPPYNYSWANGETTNTADSLCTGFVSYTVTDAEGCQFVGSVYIDFPNNIHSSNNSAGFSIFPNPTSGSFLISLSSPLQKSVITIYDAIGKKIYTEEISASKQSFKKEYDLNLAKGVYFVQLNEGKKINAQKLVIQ